MQAIRLFHDWDSLQSFKVRLCLAEADAPWHGEVVSIARFENLHPDYVKINPLGVVPTVIADGEIIVESSIINEYVNERFTEGRLLPGSPEDRARGRMWARLEDDVAHPAIRLATFNLMIKQRVRRMAPGAFEAAIAAHPWPTRAAAYRRAATAEIDSGQVIEAIRAFKALITKMETTLATCSWLIGHHYSLADIAMTPIVDRIEHLGMAELWSEAPHVAAWIERVRRRPNYGLSIAPTEKRLPPPDPETVRTHLALAEPEGPGRS